MTLLEEIQNGENAVLEFKEERPKDSLKFTKTVVAFANGKGGAHPFRRGGQDRATCGHTARQGRGRNGCHCGHGREHLYACGCHRHQAGDA